MAGGKGKKAMKILHLYSNYRKRVSHIKEREGKKVKENPLS
jgi:hypothetical protein